ncbi:10312_t:CDS:2 [Gigaspora margarita]|uniref:10312_t:CDS:1 n=1 Tax=Gigaspora margarita TaxID=4874 RepID=A0ABN7V3S4_GIGMA|nr:10312_t:CDS:2 [Gigaspora margarita]
MSFENLPVHIPANILLKYYGILDNSLDIMNLPKGFTQPLIMFNDNANFEVQFINTNKNNEILDEENYYFMTNDEVKQGCSKLKRLNENKRQMHNELEKKRREDISYWF